MSPRTTSFYRWIASIQSKHHSKQPISQSWSNKAVRPTGGKSLHLKRSFYCCASTHLDLAPGNKENMQMLHDHWAAISNGVRRLCDCHRILASRNVVVGVRTLRMQRSAGGAGSANGDRQAEQTTLSGQFRASGFGTRRAKLNPLITLMGVDESKTFIAFYDTARIF